MKRIALIVVIVACVISLGLVWKVGSNKKGQKAEIAKLSGDLTDTNGRLDKTKTDLTATKGERDQAQAKLTDTETKLTAANTTIEEKTKAVADLEAKVTESDNQVAAATAKMVEVNGTLQKIKDALGIGDVVDVDQLRQKATAQADENKVLGAQLAKCIQLTTTPEGVKGQVAAVEGKWGFMVLNVGSADKVHKAAEFLVYRDSKLIGKAQVTYAGPNTSIAQMLPEYRHAVPRVGDLVTR